MRTRFLRGTTAENNGLTLPAGELSIDTDRNAVRLHDGTTPGGFEAVGAQAVYLPPGPQTMIASYNANYGFYGEVPVSQFVDGIELATMVGFSAGDAVNTAEPWLKFNYNNRTVYIAKKHHRINLSWEQLYQAGLVYGVNNNGITPVGTATNQLTTFQFNGFTFKVRLMRGAYLDPADYFDTANDPSATHWSEWNRLMYTVSAYNPSSQEFPNWAEYTNAELEVDTVRTICQETRGNNTDYRITRGGGSFQVGRAEQLLNPTTSIGSGYGWRPVIELVE